MAIREDNEPVCTSADNTISEATRQRIVDGVPDNTRRAYTRCWTMFETWCVAVGRTTLPATSQTMTEYVGVMSEDGKSPSTIEQCIAAIRTAHKAAGFDKPDTTAARLVLRAHRRDRADGGQRAHQAPPITIDALRKMIDATDPDTLIGKRDRLVLVLGLAMMARRSELVALDVSDVVETDDGLEVTIRRGKTDQDARCAVVAVPRGQHAETDPVRLLRTYKAALAEQDVTSGKLLRSITRHGRAGAKLTDDAISRIVTQAAQRAELPNADGYTAHSLRAGGATVAYKGGAPVSAIAAHGRWAPASPVVLGYIRSVDRWTDNPMNGAGL